MQTQLSPLDAVTTAITEGRAANHDSWMIAQKVIQQYEIAKTSESRRQRFAQEIDLERAIYDHVRANIGTIMDQSARVRELETVLRPFAEIGADIAELTPKLPEDDGVLVSASGGAVSDFTLIVGNLLRAAKVMEGR